MTIAKLQQFLAVCQFQSVTRAAEFLHISQPSVSGTIRELEHEFQVNLFRHEGRRLVLTAEGSFLREHAQQAAAQGKAARSDMDDAALQALVGAALGTVILYATPIKRYSGFIPKD